MSQNNIIESAIESGHQFIILEPREMFEASIKEFHPIENRLVYNIEMLLECLKESYGWDSEEALEWFDYNIYDLTFLKGGPIFYDEFEESYLTIND